MGYEYNLFIISQESLEVDGRLTSLEIGLWSRSVGLVDIDL